MYDNRGVLHTTDLRKVGGSIVLAVPPALLDLLKLGVGIKVDIDLENGRLTIERKACPSYSLDELLAQCGEADVLSAEDRAWIDAKPGGNELM